MEKQANINNNLKENVIGEPLKNTVFIPIESINDPEKIKKLEGVNPTAVFLFAHPQKQSQDE